MSDWIKCAPMDQELAKRRPQAAKYAQIHGKRALLSEEWPTCDYHAQGYKTSEKVYEECLNQGITWQELLNFNSESLDDITL